MAMKITEKMKGFIDEYKNFEREGVKRLKDIIKWDGKKELKEIDGKYMYLTTFSNMDTIDTTLYCASNNGEAILVREFNISESLSAKINKVIDGTFKVYGISDIMQVYAGNKKCKTGIYFDDKITLVILTKYGTFKISEYYPYCCSQNEKIAEIMNAIVGNKEITILPSSNSEFNKACQKDLSYYLSTLDKDNLKSKSGICWDLEKFTVYDEHRIMESSVYLKGKHLFNISGAVENLKIAATFNMYGEKTCVYSNIARYDFSTLSLNEFLKEVYFTVDSKITEDEFSTLCKKRVCDVSFEEICSQILKDNYFDMINFKSERIEDIIHEIEYNNDSIKAKVDDFKNIKYKDSFLGRLYFTEINLNSYEDKKAKYAVYLHDVKDYKDEECYRNRILFVEDLSDEESDVIVLSTFEILKQIYSKLNKLTCTLKLPFFYFDMVGIGLGNMNMGNYYNSFRNKSLAYELEKNAFDYIYNMLKDIEIKITLKSKELSLDKDFIKNVFFKENIDKITFKKEKKIGFHDVSILSCYVDDKLIGSESKDCIQKETSAMLGDNRIFVMRYNDEEITKTFKELDMYKDGMKAVPVKDADIINKLIQL